MGARGRGLWVWVAGRPGARDDPVAEAEGCAARRARHHGLIPPLVVVDLARGAGRVGAAGEVWHGLYRAVYHARCVPVLSFPPRWTGRWGG